MKCWIIKNIIPYYIDNKDNNDKYCFINKFINSHLKKCSKCRKVYDNFKEDEKFLQKNLNNFIFSSNEDEEIWNNIVSQITTFQKDESKREKRKVLLKTLNLILKYSFIGIILIIISLLISNYCTHNNKVKTIKQTYITTKRDSIKKDNYSINVNIKLKEGKVELLNDTKEYDTDNTIKPLESLEDTYF